MLVSSDQRRTGPSTEPGFSQGFFSSPFLFWLSLMEFWFLANVAFVLFSWGQLISGKIAELIAQILFELNYLNDDITES